MLINNSKMSPFLHKKLDYRPIEILYLLPGGDFINVLAFSTIRHLQVESAYSKGYF